MYLSEMAIQEEALIKELHHEGSIKRRLLDLGIMKGATIQPILSGPRASMRAYLIKGTLIALRKSEADLIEIK